MTMVWCFVYHSISVLNLSFFRVENILSHMCVLLNTELIFSAKSKAVNIAHYY